LNEPAGPGGIIFFTIVALGIDIALFCYQWKKINENDTFMQPK